jgi:hypothetical protein
MMFSRGSRGVISGLFPVAALLPLLGCAKAASTAAEAPSFMFVQVAEDVQTDTMAMTLRLHNITPQVIFFSDRPNRLAGHITLAQYLHEWTPAAGADNLGADPPNATLSVYEPGQPDNAITIVELANPRLDGPDMIYDYKLVDGRVPTNGGTTALFIDRVGVGGGVGPGSPGVGVGGPGPGVR